MLSWVNKILLSSYRTLRKSTWIGNGFCWAFKLCHNVRLLGHHAVITYACDFKLNTWGCRCPFFTPQPFRLEGYCRHRSGGRPAAKLAEPISLQPLDGFSPFKVLWNCLGMKLCTVMVICPFAPYGLAHGPKTCQICHKLGPDFAERISLKLLDGFTPFKVLWTCLDL